MAKSFPNTGATVGLAADRTALTSPFAGMQFFETDTKALYLYNGSAWVSMLDTDTPPGLVHINTTSMSASTGATISNCFSADYVGYRINLNGSLGTSNGQNIYAQLTSSGTPSSSGYNMQRLYVQSTTVGGSRSTAATTGFTLSYVGTTSLDIGGNSVVDIFNPFLTKQTSCIVNSCYVDASNVVNLDATAGLHTVLSSFDGIKVYPAAGTLTTTVSIYGYRT